MNGKILVNRTSVFSSYIVHLNDEIEVNIDFEEEDNILPQQMDLEILYEDDPNKVTYQISNNHGHINGWVGKSQIYGKVVEILWY